MFTTSRSGGSPKFLFGVVLLLTIGCRTIWDGEWGPAKFSFRFKDAKSGAVIAATRVRVDLSGEGYDPAPRVTQTVEQTDLEFQANGISGIDGPFGSSGGIHIVFKFTAPGFVERALRYPEDFDVVNYNSNEKIEWKPEVEFHGRTLHLKPVAGE
jgi:hypothetical protein